MLTNSSDVRSRVKGLIAGADDYLPKPFDRSELLARYTYLPNTRTVDTTIWRLRSGSLQGFRADPGVVHEAL